jgi:hypothetical protein
MKPFLKLFPRRPALFLLATLTLLPAIGCAASNHDFDAVVSSVEHRYSVHAQRVPMMGFVSLCARVATGGGVKGMRIAEFDHLAAITDTNELSRLVGDSLGGEWQRFVTDRQGNGNLSVIFVRPEGQAMRMLIADYEHGDLNVVRMELNGDQLSHWMNDPEGHAHRHDYASAARDDGGRPD